MDENKTDETTGENTNETENKPSNFFEWLAQYGDEKKYPKKPTPPSVYWRGIVYGTALACLIVFGLYSLSRYMDMLPENALAVCIVGFLVLSFLFSWLFVLVSQCVIRYGLPETARTLPKVLLFTLLIALLGFFIFFACISDYYPIGFLLLGLLIGTIVRAVNKS